MFKKLEDVTYEAFGIKTSAFYKNKFNRVPHQDYMASPVTMFHIGSGRIKYLLRELSGGKVLDIGCGNGHYGMTLKKHGAADYLVGVDLDAECLKQAKRYYDEVVRLEVLDKLPFADESFDAVFSGDFFGHLEFRYKDALLAEIHRVLKPGGKTIHLIESGDSNYLQCNQDDPNDPVRQYVHVDGHIGVEPAIAIKQRFGRFFENIVMRNAMLFPFFNVQGMIGNVAFFDTAFSKLLGTFTQEEAQAADIVTGFLCEYTEQAALRMNPLALDPTANVQTLPPELTQSCGMVFLAGKKSLQRKKVMVVFGTRPEVIKMAPVIAELKRYPDCELKVCFTGQHKEMAQNLFALFGIEPDYQLEIVNSTLCGSAAEILKAMDKLFGEWRPDLLLVQGDTNSVSAAAQAAFYHQIEVGHIEAGLRTFNKHLPFPEEINRVITTRIADWHFAPTGLARQNLLNEGIAPERIFVTGNTVIDALLQTTDNLEQHPELESEFSFLSPGKKLILLTGHRRENQQGGIAAICETLKTLVQRGDVEIIFPVHRNPNVRTVVEDALTDIPNIHLCPPLDYLRFVYILNRATLVMTDSGGVQEEASALGKPLVLLRDVTERPEVLDLPQVRAVGTNTQKILAAVEELLAQTHLPQSKSCAFGDGKAAHKIAAAIFGRSGF